MTRLSHRFSALAALLVLVVSRDARAQEPQASPQALSPISTDAPTVSRTSHAVGDGILQWETGASYSSFSSGPDLVNLPGTLRYGVNQELELRLETNGLSFQGLNHGYSDLSLGLKYEFEPSWTVVGLMTFPTGYRSLKGPGFVPFLSLNHDIQFTGDDNILFNAGGSLLPNGGGLQAFGTACYCHTFSAEVSGFLEGAVQGNQMAVDAGLQIYPDDNFVINLQALRGLSGVQRWGGYLGFGVRFP